MARLYICARFAEHWITEHHELADAGVFVMWPAIVGGWQLRELYRGNRHALREVEPRLAYGTGWPDAPGSGRPTRAGVVADRFTLRLTPAERARWQHLAGERPLGEWIRERCNGGAALVEWVRASVPPARPAPSPTARDSD